VARRCALSEGSITGMKPATMAYGNDGASRLSTCDEMLGLFAVWQKIGKPSDDYFHFIGRGAATKPALMVREWRR